MARLHRRYSRRKYDTVEIELELLYRNHGLIVFGNAEYIPERSANSNYQPMPGDVFFEHERLNMVGFVSSLWYTVYYAPDKRLASWGATKR